jgi:hypothetical protein
MWIAAGFADMKPLDFTIAVAVAALLAMGVFAHANKRGNRHATAWGVATFLFAAIALPLYFVRYSLSRNRS